MPDRPELLIIALIAIPVGLILWRRYSTGRRDLEVIGGNWLKVDFANVFVVKWFFSALFFLLFILLAAGAAAGFRWGSKPVPDERIGQEIVFVFDLSNSMLADDIAPTRLKRSALLAREIALETPGAKFSVVGFKGHASLFIPMTEDTTALNNLFDVISPELLTSPGTDIGAGILTGANAFTKMFESHRTMFLFTDGETLSGDPAVPAGELSTEKISLVVIGVGGSGAARIPLSDGSYLSDQDGNELTTELRRDVINNIVEAADGTVLWAEDSGIRDQALGEVGASRRVTGWGYEYESSDRYRLFLAAALICLAISVGTRLVRWRDIF